jgi:phosphoribosylformylglycinamidine cyclo-ligase
MCSARVDWTLDRYVPSSANPRRGTAHPTRIYARDCLALIEAVEVHAMSHITGGGLANNLPESFPLPAKSDRPYDLAASPIFGLIQQLGTITQPDLERPSIWASAWSRCLPPIRSTRHALLAERGLDGWVCGSLRLPIGEAGAGTPVRQHVVG